MSIAAQTGSQPLLQPVASPPVRPLPSVADRVLMIGLDGATFDVLDPMMEQGRMPNLERFIANGAAGILRSTKPPITPAAWTTFMTGKGPGRHGILDFEKYDAFAHELSFNSTYEIREKTIWEILSEKGFRVGAINVPMMYPPKPVNGFVITGFETPSIEAEFTYPRDLKQEIFKLIPNYNYRTNWKRRTFGGDAVLAENLDYISRSFDQGQVLTQYCGDRYGWDVMMVLYKLVDNLQHKAWKYLDPRYTYLYPRRAEMAADVFSKLDVALGKLFDYADANGATVMIMSDHGHGSLDGRAQPNLLLKNWGYLCLRSSYGRSSTRAAHWFHRLTKGKVTRFEQGSRGIERELAVDWSQTRACVMHAGIYGFLYINLKGRGPHGIVEPSDYEALRTEIMEKLMAVRARRPDGREIAVFPHVYRAEELYNCSREDNPQMPDLLLSPEPGLAVVRKIRGNTPVRWCSVRRMEGTHREEGVFAMGGPNVRRGLRMSADIADLAPTLLSSMGLRVPGDMEGRALTELFSPEPTVEREPPVRKVFSASAEVYSEEERKLLEKRLSELGYLE
ncbi:MAG: alkaline phosphatase family protein [Phycisphaerae bacterium]|nr:alkaline phosphatase family protein [Phycisphaerae bacterium]